ncbi:MAG: hypothetical protein HKN82_07420 [Akkermansiaceae bacterium]|nr:hypothetical protein [Akkermansiaceae bacterium]NNM28499.1 hypothetical protein [Akkermansiaceae bacterium]
MNMQQHLSSKSIAAGGAFLAYLAQLQAGEVGPMAVYDPPAPISDCDACNVPGWYGGVSLLYLKPYLGGDGGEGVDGDWDLGARGTLGFERPDGLFYELNGFWYESEFDFDNRRDNRFAYDNELSTYYIEGLIGDNLHCGEACLDLAFGIRYASLELDESERRVNFDGAEGQTVRVAGNETWEFDGIGPVVRLDGTRQLNEQVTLYAGLSQAILFGEQKFSGSSTNRLISSGNPGSPTGPAMTSGGSSKSDTVAFVTELEGGVMFNLNMGALQDAHVKLGIEGQYWSVGGSDLGLFGGVLGVGFSF